MTRRSSTALEADPSPAYAGGFSPAVRARSRGARRVTLIGAAAGAGLAAAQLLTGWLGRSQALIADGVHSLSDLATDAAVWLALGLAARPPDAEHPWGHGKIETLASALVGAVLAFVGFWIGAEAVDRVRTGVFLRPTVLPVLAALAGVAVKEGLFRWTVRMGRRLRSQALVANAWHHRSDALSSVAALVGAGAAWLGVPWMDAVGAAAVSLFIVQVGVRVSWRGLQELLERQVEPELLARVQRLLEEDPQVLDAHRLRLRNVGGVIVGDVHVTVDGELTVREGHAVALRLEERALREIPHLEDLVIHVDPPGVGHEEHRGAPATEARRR